MNTQTAMNGVTEWMQALSAWPASYVNVLLVALALTAVLLVAWQAREKKRRLEKLQQQKLIDELRAQLRAQSSATLLLSERVSALEENLETVGTRQQRLENQKQRRQQSYEDAIRIADSVSPEELMSRYGITSSEADLINLLYGKAS